jgi:hypothetical protein
MDVMQILFVHGQDIDDRAVTIYVWDGTDAPPAGGLLYVPPCCKL